MVELKWTIKRSLFMQIKINVMMLGITYLMSKLPDQQYSMVPTWAFGLMLPIGINIAFSLAFTVTYFSKWKPEINEKYKEEFLYNKYSFLHNRFIKK